VPFLVTGAMHRILKLTQPLDLAATLRPVRRGFNDPTMRIDGQRVVRATRTPEGPATTQLDRSGDRIEVTAWGPGAVWALDHSPELIGLHDDPAGFLPVHPIVHDLHRRHPGLRIPRSLAVFEAMSASIIEQKVTGLEARRSYGRLTLKYSEPAPGPHRLTLPPAPAALNELGYYDLHPFGIEKKRADTLLRVSRMAARIDALSTGSPAEAYQMLNLIPGVGPWTAAEVGVVALGDPDAVSVGDYHLPNLVAWTLAGEARGDDARMLELLAPYRGHRARVVKLLEQSGNGAPRRGPRYSPVPFAKM
jgi:3-methyladenine DNA glycosylase/8-oxoguanine DNA glycosylase